MKKQFKKLTAVLLTAAMLLGVFSVVPVSAFAADVDDNSVGSEEVFTSSDEEYEYTKNDDGTITITGYNDRGPYNLVIPGTIDGYTVTKIGDKAFYKKSFSLIQLPDSVTSIGDYAFASCYSLRKIDLPDSVTSIGAYSFSNSVLSSVSLSKNLISIGAYAFYDSPDLDWMQIPDSVTYIGPGAFAECTDLESIYISNSLKTLESKIFYGSGLETIDLPDSITSIESYAFQDCDSLKRIDLSDNITSIGVGAFQDCDALTSIDFSDNLALIGDNAFQDCDSLIRINLPDKLTSIGKEAFLRCKNLQGIDFSNGVSSIGSHAFEECDNIYNITIPNSVKYIGDGAFYNCSNLGCVTILSGITAIEEYTFAFCQSLYYIDIPDSVISIERYAFTGCKYLDFDRTNLPNGLKYIKDYAFQDCTCITKITIPSGTYIESNAFSGFGKNFKICGYKYSDAYEFAKNNHILFIPADSNPFDYNMLSDGSIEITHCNFNKDDYNAYYGYPDKSRYGTLYIPDEIDGHKVTSIGNCAFAFNNNFDTIYVPSSVTKVQGGAFMDCKYVRFFGDLTYIGAYAFSGCREPYFSFSDSMAYLDSFAFAEAEISSIYIPGSISELPDALFYNCKNLNDVEICEGVKSIGKDVFFGTNVSTLTIPDSVTNIDGCLYAENIKCNRGTFAFQYAIAYNTRYTILDAVKGDVNLDGEVNIKDATRLQMAISGAFDDDPEYKLMDNFYDVADSNEDDKISVEDVTLLQKNIAKCDSE